MGTAQDAGRGRPRRPETDDRILRATLQLLRDQGPEAVSVAAVAARSGVARTTIYRRYRDRAELLRSALEPVTTHDEPPAAASVRAKFGWVLAGTEELLAGSIGLGGVAALLAGRDPDFGVALRAALESALEPVRAQIVEDVARGRLAAHVDADALLNLVLGSYLAEVLRHGAPRPGWLDRTARLLADSLGAT